MEVKNKKREELKEKYKRGISTHKAVFVPETKIKGVDVEDKRTKIKRITEKV